MTKTTRSRAPQRRVHCTECDWSGKRGAEEVASAKTLDPCPQCGAKVVAGSGQVGRPALAADKKKVEVRPFVLPSTLVELERVGDVGMSAAQVLDEWAASRRLLRSDRAKQAARTRSRVRRSVASSRQ